jgi:hypothetical protein
MIGMRTVVSALCCSLIAVAQTVPAGYLCVAEQATGLSYDKQTDK